MNRQTNNSNLHVLASSCPLSILKFWNLFFFIILGGGFFCFVFCLFNINPFCSLRKLNSSSLFRYSQIHASGRHLCSLCFQMSDAHYNVNASHPQFTISKINFTIYSSFPISSCSPPSLQNLIKPAPSVTSLKYPESNCPVIFDSGLSFTLHLLLIFPLALPCLYNLPSKIVMGSYIYHLLLD